MLTNIHCNAHRSAPLQRSFKLRSFQNIWATPRPPPGLAGLLLARSTHPSDSHPPPTQSRPWYERITVNPARSIVVSILLVVALGWDHHRSEGGSKDSSSLLEIDRYRPFPISNSKLVAPGAALLHINLSVPELDAIKSLFYIESIYLKHPALQIERPYTPLSSITPYQPPSGVTNAPRSVDIDLLVKRYSDGDMSTYLHHVKTPGNQVEIRGPVTTWHHPDDHQIDELIAAGTGITPAIQLLRRFLTRNSDQQRLPKFKLIYLARSLESAYFMDEISSYQSNHPELVDLKLLVTNETNHTPHLGKRSVDKVGSLQFSDIQKWVGKNQPERKKIIIVCGPESLICAVAGCKGRTYNSQGQLGGMLKSLGYSSDQVVKL